MNHSHNSLAPLFTPNEEQKKVLVQRQKKLSQQIEGGIVVLFSADLKSRSHDTHFPFRQKSHLHYLTMYPEEGAIFVMTTTPEVKSYLFVHDKNPQFELWEGKRYGDELAKSHFPVDDVFSLSLFSEKIEQFIRGHDKVYADLFEQQNKIDTKLYDILKKSNQKKRDLISFPDQLHDLAPVIGRMRLIKDELEVKLMKKSADIACLAHQAAMAMAKDGLYEYQIHAVMDYLFKYHGATGSAYDAIVASGENANTLHYINNNQQLKDGQYLLIDAGCEYDFYASDITRTFPINGKFQGKAKDLYQLVLEVQKKAIQRVEPGTTIPDIHKNTTLDLIEGLVHLKVLNGKTEDLFESGEYKTFFPHGTGHWLGIDVHDQCPYIDHDKKPIRLQKGMVLTIEPGLYFSETNQQAPQDLVGLGIRIEDDILVSETGRENLTQAAPKEIQEVEEACEKSITDFYPR